jgi:hypothetical protein
VAATVFATVGHRAYNRFSKKPVTIASSRSRSLSQQRAARSGQRFAGSGRSRGRQRRHAHACGRIAVLRGDSGSRMAGRAARRMISGDVLAEREGLRLVMEEAQRGR